MDRESLVKWWDEAWKTGLWAAAWSKAVDGLTPQQAAWKPAAGRNCIWQMVNHMLFWREENLRRLAGEPGTADDEKARLNFLAPAEVTEAAWRAARERFAATHARLSKAFADPRTPLEQVSYLLPHDAYHVGQIMYVRALQGLPPIE